MPQTSFQQDSNDAALPQQQRSKLRRQLKRARGSLTKNQLRQRAVALGQQFLASPWSWRAGRVGSYLAGNGEMDPAIIHQCLWTRHQTLAVPVIRSHQLEFFELSRSTPLQQGPFGIPEPAAGAKYIDSRSISLLLMPLVGFDANGNRLGMGGGFYDRHLAQLPKGMRPTLIGIAHEFQQVPQIPTEAWDVPLDGLLTERRWHSF